MIKIIANILLLSLFLSQVNIYAQISNEEYYNYLEDSNIHEQIELEDLQISYERDNTYRYKSILYLKSDTTVLDSSAFDNGYVQFHEAINPGDRFNAWYINKDANQSLNIFILQNKFQSNQISGLDTLYLFEYLYGYNYFVDKYIYVNTEGERCEGHGFKLYRGAFGENGIDMLFDFYQLEEIKSYESWSPYLPLVTKLYSIGRNNKILVETGIFDGGLTDLNYFILDTRANEVQNITQTSNFQTLVSDPKKHLVNYPHYKHLSFEPKIGNGFIVDCSDTLAYFSSDFHESDARWDQDAFVMDKRYKIIGRVLKRKIGIVGYTFRSNEKFYRVRSNVNGSTGDFDLQLKYPMERAFYNLYYDSLLNRNAVVDLNLNELLILKNFIFAKHNYQFNSPFYQAFFNTFTFYSSKESKKQRRKDVNGLLTEMDKKNLDMIMEKIRDL
ncbi:YARHG domain-containing protein [Fulvivirga sp. 29W222]|uniref:YARHG domain-containing protein n=1 Tax=Fulvivirga marina TaxID=2494733 RepID=A0A937G0M7_9BACT|nr:YARHG domain-containing protein [Fulvivirga marina]MBL6448462.1 YARHG domain-containing protein [Fulvivirga marina]